jgi:hypothetical protein
MSEPLDPQESEARVNRFLLSRIQETLEWMELNYDEDVTEEDALEHLMGECGQTPDGGCQLAGSEQCEFECPFRDAL